MITPKKRFEVLKRDGFRCTYCGRNGKDVTLEVDHIISKKGNGNDTMENLTTCCRECNMGKGSDEIEKPAKNLYKQKINDTLNRVKDYFYNEWNIKLMNTIDKNTYVLLCMYLTDIVKGQDGLNYCGFVGSGENEKLFKQGGDYCNSILEEIYVGCTKDYIDDLIKEVFSDEYWTQKDNDDNERYRRRLNWELTEHLDAIMGEKNYAIKKYTLFPKLLTNG